MVLVLTCSMASAQGRRCTHYLHYHTYARVYTTLRVVPHSIIRHRVATHISNHFSQKERLSLAIAFLNQNDYLSVKQYIKITGLSKDAAEAELESFAQDDKNQIVAKLIAKKRVYTKG